MDGFWAVIEAQLEALKAAGSADDVIAALPEKSAGDAFFGGSGGDGTVFESLREAGWTVEWRKASYYWAMRAPDGSGITYVEGDIYRGIQQPPA